MIVALVTYHVFANGRIRRGIVFLSERFDPGNR